MKNILITSSGKFYLKQKWHSNRDQVLFPYNWHQRRHGLRYAWLDNHSGFPGDSDGKESSCNAGDLGLIPGLGRSPGEGNGTPLQYSGLENSMDRGVWKAIVHGVAKRQTGLSDFHTHKQSFRNQNSDVNFRQQDCKYHKIPIICPGICKDYFQNTEGDIFQRPH